MSSVPQKRTLEMSDQEDNHPDFISPYNLHHLEQPKLPFYHNNALLAQQSGTAMLENEANSGNQATQCMEELGDSDDEGEKKGINYDKLDEAGSRAMTALTILQAVFPELFPTRDDAKTYIQKAKDDESGQLQQLLEGVRDIYHTMVLKDIIKGDTMSDSATQPSRLKNFVRPFISEVHPTPMIPGTKLRCSLWPFVRLVRYYLNARNLQSGSIIVDTPGVTDTDCSRVDETRRYIQSSDVTVIVNEFGRMATDKGNYVELKVALQRKGPGGALLVGTNTDKIREHDNPPFTLAEEQRLWDKQKARCQLKDQVEKVDKEAVDAASNADPALALQMQKDLASKRKALLTETVRLDHSINDIRMKTLHRRVVSEVRDYRGARPGENEVPIYLVSSLQWIDKHLRGYRITEPPMFSREATGIPALSNFIYGRPAEGKFVELDHWVTNRLPYVLNRLEMLATISNLNQKELALQSCKEARSRSIEKINTHFDSLQEGTLLKIVSKMRASEKIFIEEAREICIEKQKTIRAQTHGAVLKRHGLYETPKIGKQNWNDEFLRPVRFRVEKSFNTTLNTLLPNKMRQIGVDIGQVIEQLVDKLRSDPSSGKMLGVVSTFEAYGKTRIGLIKHEVDTTRANLDDKLREIHTLATQNMSDAYFTLAMRPIYDKAVHDAKGKKRTKGTSLHSVRCDLFLTAISKANGPFNVLIKEVEREFKAAIVQFKHELSQKVDAVFRPIEEDIHREMRKEELEKDNPARKQWLSELAEMVHEARPMVKETEELLETCKKETLSVA
ncbi:hypothetical protein DM02DRAFT_727736 [Periconia macrospinosa]|uniref:DUF7605 domain-containing protein n=1 Tax=Periconia macrospinosa TaxID=97972 RepID=A0A2V1DUD9_9PLEO|nr:hypothetical protein DM02DRAFT_727736 [Periconia macrospinosa]